MNPSLPLIIVTPFGFVFEGECDGAYFPAETGPLGILPGHTPFLAALAAQGVIKILAGSETLFFAIRGGALEVKPNRTVVLSEFCVKASSEEEANDLLLKLKESSENKNEDVKRAQSLIMSRLSSDSRASFNEKPK
jgi:F-type H+-transporting ATPase subunit epsilon